MKKFHKIVVVGAGTMGNGIAQVFAMHGYGVTLVDIEKRFLDRGLNAIQESLNRFVAKDVISEDEAKAVEAWVASKDPGQIERWLQMEGGRKMLATLCKTEIGLKSTLNDHLEHVPIKFVTPKEVIRGLNKHGCRFVGKADLEKGFRQIILSEDSFPHIVVKMYMRGSSDSPWTEAYVVDATAVMGLKKSPPYFEKVVSLFVSILITHFPGIFLAKNLAESERAFVRRFGANWDPKSVARVLVDELQVVAQEGGVPLRPGEKIFF